VTNLDLTVEHLSSGYGRNEILHDLTFRISDPGIQVVIGKNGAGKTTLFRTLLGLLKLRAGTITYNGSDLLDSNTKLGYLGHSLAIPMGFSVKKALEFYAMLEGLDSSAVRDVATKLGLNAIIDAKFVTLSQGQKKRVSLAKCFLAERDVYIFDEPTTNLDPEMAAEIRGIIESLARDRIILYSSHNLYEANELGTRVIALDNGRISYDGRIDGIRRGKYLVGIKGTGFESVSPRPEKRGEYYVYEVSDASRVGDLIQQLINQNVRIFEVKELSNPLETLYDNNQ
jgi:ABC-2 type transport system ATP-binding protein